MPPSTSAASCCLWGLRCGGGTTRAKVRTSLGCQYRALSGGLPFHCAEAIGLRNPWGASQLERKPVQQDQRNIRWHTLRATNHPLRMSAAVAASGSSLTPPKQEEAKATGAASDGADDSPIVQYLVIRKDLVEVEKWPLGALLAQASHAAVAAVWLNREDPATIEYCTGTNLDNMHKVGLSGCFFSPRFLFSCFCHG